jgi:2-oxoglutarate dehydrogenase E1 component
VQIHRSFRKPLVVFTPKNLLRHPKAKSKLLEFDDKADDPNIVGVRFKRLIMDNRETDRSPDPPPRPEVKRLIFCSGKVYYELEAARDEKGMSEDIAIARVEQLAPFPFDLVMRELKRYPGAQVRGTKHPLPLRIRLYLCLDLLLVLGDSVTDLKQATAALVCLQVMWAQEEPMNMGPYWHCATRIETCLRELGRDTNGRVLYSGRPPSAATATGFGDYHAQEMKELLDNSMDLGFSQYM